MSHFGLQHDNRGDAQLQVDTSKLACELVASGIGCAVVIERFAKTAIQYGRPIAIVGEPIPLHQSHVLLKSNSTSEGPVLAEIEAFKEWIRLEFVGSDPA